MNKTKRTVFSQVEKELIRSLVMKYKDIVESKKSDAFSIVQKREYWDTITNEFNSIQKFSPRSVAQLKKAWENIKTREKSEALAGREGRLKTGGTYTSRLAPDPELDAILGFDSRLIDAFDSDTVAASLGYNVVDNTSVSNEIDPLSVGVDSNGGKHEITAEDHQRSTVDDMCHQPHSVDDIVIEPATVEVQAPPSPTQTERGSSRRNEGESFRMERNQLVLKQEQQLHERRMKESKIRREILEQEKYHAQQLFQRKMRSEVNAEIRNRRESKLRRLLLLQKIRLVKQKREILSKRR